MPAHGHVADRSKWRITVIMHIAETREKAFADAEWGFPEWIDYTHDVIPAPPAFPRGVANPAQFCLDNQLGIIGTPDDAIREIERIRQALGGFGVILAFGNDLAPFPAQLRSFELLAEFVKPHFSRANASRRQATNGPPQIDRQPARRSDGGRRGDGYVQCQAPGEERSGLGTPFPAGSRLDLVASV